MAGPEIIYKENATSPIPVTARSSAWVCGRLLAGNASSNLAEGMDICCDCCVVRYRSLRRDYHSSRGVLPSVVCPSVIEEPHRGCLGALQQSSNEYVYIYIYIYIYIYTVSSKNALIMIKAFFNVRLLQNDG